MTTSEGTSFPARFTKIDDLTRADHSYIQPDDECLFLGDYTARKGWAYSATNQLIHNFKMPVRHRGTNRWPHKQRAIRTVAGLFSAQIASHFGSLTLVPVPPSKLRTDPEYDDRLMGMLRALSPPAGLSADIRELVVQTSQMAAAHESEQRPPPSAWEGVYAIDETLSAPEPTWVGIVDDLLVTGCRFRAMSNVLRRRFPAARITGLFIARRVPEAIDPADIFGDLDF